MDAAFSAPSNATLQGVLLDADGAPLAGARAYRLRFHNAETAGDPLSKWYAGTVVVTPTGRWAIRYVPEELTLAADEVWYELGIDSSPIPDGVVDEADKFPGRFPVQGALFSHQAADAAQLGGLLPEDYSPADHDHDSDYSPVDHDHDDAYAAIDHRVHGHANTANPGSGVGGGSMNDAAGNISFIGAGDQNQTSDSYTFIGAGASNRAQNSYAAILGGWGNIASGSHSSMGGGEANRAAGQHAVVGGGWGNEVLADYGTIAGGAPPPIREPLYPDQIFNRVIDQWGFVGGGGGNVAGSDDGAIQDPLNAPFATVSGGRDNRAMAPYSTIGGGGPLLVESNPSNDRVGNRVEPAALGGTIAGGLNNSVAAEAATVGGGSVNRASGEDSVIAGGYWNEAAGRRSAVGGGYQHIASGQAVVIGGGWRNETFSDYSTIGGGGGNKAGEEDGSGQNATVGGGGSNAARGHASTIGGGSSNSVYGGNGTVGGGHRNTVIGEYGTIAGGGEQWEENYVFDDYGTIGGGADNHAGSRDGDSSWPYDDEDTTNAPAATVSGGTDNRATRAYSTVGGGEDNRASAEHATVAGGQSGKVWDNFGTIGGGGSNQAGTDDDNTGSEPYTTVAGGRLNHAVYKYSTVGGGERNHASGHYATVSGGGPSDLSNDDTKWDTRNRVLDNYGTVGGGGGNQAGGLDAGVTDAQFATVAGGRNNFAVDRFSTVGGGEMNHAWARYATVAGGGPSNLTDDSTKSQTRNRVLDNYGTVGGGGGNVAGSADGNPASHQYGTVPGGKDNTAEGWYSFAAGHRAKAIHNGSFVWADSTDASVWSERHDQFRVRANGGVRLDAGANGVLVHSTAYQALHITSDNPEFNHPLSVSGGPYTYMSLDSGGNLWIRGELTEWNQRRDKAASPSAPVDARDVLLKLSSVPAQEWTSTEDSEGGKQLERRRIGPDKQALAEVLGIGHPGNGMSLGDADGVSLTAIQALHEIVQQQQAMLAHQQIQIDALEREIQALQARQNRQ